jgi:hypothetical protein
MDLKVVQLATQLLKNGFDNFAEVNNYNSPQDPTVAISARGCGELIVERRRRTVWPRTPPESGAPLP